MKKTAMYPGSFDPVTYGHLDIIKRAMHIFDNLLVAVIDNPQKKPLFITTERKAMLEKVCKNWSKVKIVTFDGLLVDYAKKQKAQVIIRGLRAVSDFEYELQMALMNRKLDSDLDTVFMMPAEPYTYLSSSIVKEIALNGGRVDKFVPRIVEQELRRKFLLTKT